MFICRGSNRLGILLHRQRLFMVVDVILVRIQYLSSLYVVATVAVGRIYRRTCSAEVWGVAAVDTVDGVCRSKEILMWQGNFLSHQTSNVYACLFPMHAEVFQSTGSYQLALSWLQGRYWVQVQGSTSSWHYQCYFIPLVFPAITSGSYHVQKCILDLHNELLVRMQYLWSICIIFSVTHVWFGKF